MKKLLIALTACIVLVGCGDKGAGFIGVWKNNEKSAQTLTVTKVDDGFRVQAKFDDPQWSSMDTEIKLKAESDERLVTADGKRILETGNTGEVTSYLYGKPVTFTKIK